jgi:hypothetical protein
MNIRARLDRLEDAGKPGVIVMWRHHSETDEQAKDRWKAAHPGEDPDRAGVRVILVQWADPQ